MTNYKQANSFIKHYFDLYQTQNNFQLAHSGCFVICLQLILCGAPEGLTQNLQVRNFD